MRAATLVLLADTKRNEVVFGRKKRGEIGKGTVNGPGGKQEAGESLTACAKRETFEELGVIVDESDLEEVGRIKVFVAEEPFMKLHVYRATRWQGEARETDEMVPCRYAIDDLPFDDMLDSDRDWVPQAIAGRAFCGVVHFSAPGSGLTKPVEFFPFDPAF